MKNSTKTETLDKANNNIAANSNKSKSSYDEHVDFIDEPNKRLESPVENVLNNCPKGNYFEHKVYNNTTPKELSLKPLIILLIDMVIAIVATIIALIYLNI